MNSFIKWAGGKEQELKYIVPNLPKTMNRFFEPFVGGGAVYFALSETKFKNTEKYINDKSVELITLYLYLQTGNNEFFDKLQALEHNWKVLTSVIDAHYSLLTKIYINYRLDKINEEELSNQLCEFILKNADEFNGIMESNFNPQIDKFVGEINKSLTRKMKRMKVLEVEKGKLSDADVLANIETAFKGAYYTHFRYLYNNSKQLNIKLEFSEALFYFIREYCYASMFRYNANGHFNVPYGGMAYNKKDFSKKIDYIMSKDMKKYLSKTEVHNEDFFDFLKKFKLTKDDFIFLDPPYDTEFSDYAKNTFNKNDQVRLAEYLYKTDAKFMLIIKNTNFIKKLYEGHGFYINTFDKKYMVNFQNRNDRQVEHLLITNYEVKYE